MKLKDFFILVTKLFGLYSIIIVLFNIMPQSLSYLLPYGIDPFMISTVVVLSAIVIALCYLLLKASPWLVEKLKLTQNFESDSIDFSTLNEQSIIMLACLIIGGITIIESLPGFISNTLYAVSKSNSQEAMEANEKFYWIMSFVKIALGLVLVTKYKSISAFVKKSTAHNTG